MPREMTIEEAIPQKRNVNALAGNSHSQRQVLADARRIEDKKQAARQAELEDWAKIKRALEKEFAAYRAQHDGAEPNRYPHPDDIILDRVKGVKIVRPINQEEANRHKQTIEAEILQDALDRAREKRRNDPHIETGGSYFMAMFLNETLPKRMRFSSDDLILKRMELRHVSQRELLKRSHHANKKAGLDTRRGAKGLPPDLGRSISDLTKDRVEIYKKGLIGRELEESINAALRTRLG